MSTYTDDQESKNVWNFIGTLLVGAFFTSLFWWAGTYTAVTLHEKAFIKRFKCQKSLPRDQTCEIVLTARVKALKENN